MLSFDDGPDKTLDAENPGYTEGKKVPGAFFVIGDEANRAPDLLKREYAEGHEIGNHTFTHPKFDEISRTQMKWELNLTQRLIESTLGVKSILFRPPYGIDHQPEYAEEVAQLPYPQELGYIIVGQRIDPDDWRVMPDNHTRPADEIVDGRSASGLERKYYSVARWRRRPLSDAGRLAANHRPASREGVSNLYPFGELIGKSRNEMMVPLSFREQLSARADGLIFGIFQWLRFVIATIFILGIILVSGRALVIGILAIIEKLRPDHAKLPEPPPSVTVLIPAHNEESVIVQTVQSVLLADYHDMHVIVVDDGSTDATLELLHSNFGKNSSCADHSSSESRQSGGAE